MINHPVDMKEAHPEPLLAAQDHETGHANTAAKEVIRGIGREADPRRENEAAQEIGEGVVAEDVLEIETEEDPPIDIREHPESRPQARVASPPSSQAQAHPKLQLSAKSFLRNGAKITARHPSKSPRSSWSWLMRRNKCLGFVHHLLISTIDE